MPEDRFDNEFVIHVQQVVGDLLANRELTMPEVRRIKEATNETWDLLLERHKAKCYQERKACMDKAIGRVYKTILFIITLFTFLGGLGFFANGKYNGKPKIVQEKRGGEANEHGE